MERGCAEPGSHQIGRANKKALYREYTDATFTNLKTRLPEDAYLGLLGPIFHGEVVRLDDSCSVDHYASDLGRTIPVSGHLTAEQREIWDVFAAASAGTKAIREGATVNQVFVA